VNLINQGKPGKPSLKISYWYNKKTVEKLLYFTWLEARYITVYTILGVVVSKNSVPVFEVFSCFFLFFLVFSCFFLFFLVFSLVAGSVLVLLVHCEDCQI
jgi:hypothetical protein